MGGFFDKLKEAFENDQNDLDPIVGDGYSRYESPVERTETQRRWLETQTQKSSMVKGTAPISADNLVGTKWKIDFYLAGIPDQDPSNNLYGSKVNISSRDPLFALGTAVPDTPSVSAVIELLENGVCKTEETEFTSGNDGQWKMQENGNMIRMGINTTGFKRILQTTGTLSKIFWSKSDEISSRASSTYSIPAGVVYGDTAVGYGSAPGTYLMNEGILQVEQTQGLFGISSKMANCGKFVATMIIETEDN